jgi:hypothetical protein
MYSAVMPNILPPRRSAVNAPRPTRSEPKGGARTAGDCVSAIAAGAGDDVTLDGVEVREVVASA